MPRGKAAAPDMVEDTPAVETNTEAGGAEEEEQEEAPAAPAQPEPTSPVADAAPVSVGGVELPLSPGEEIISQRVDDDAILWAVSNFGRKLRIDPDGNIEVVTGPGLDVVIPATPKSTAVGILTGGAAPAEA